MYTNYRIYYNYNIYYGDYVILALFDKIIDEYDCKRGFILEDELLRIYGNKIKKDDITEKSVMVEYVTSTHEFPPITTESKKFPIKKLL